MKILNFYIAKQILIVTLMSTLVLCATVTLLQSLQLINLIVEKGVLFVDFLKLAGLGIPRYLIIVLPLTLLGSAIFVFNRLLSDRELIVMRACGISNVRFLLIGLWSILLALFFTYFLSLYAGPHSARAFEENLYQLRSRIGVSFLREGVFTPIGDNLLISVKRKGSNGSLLGIFIYDQRNPKQPSTIMAEKGVIVDPGDGSLRIVVENGSQQTLIKNVLHVVNFKTSTFDLESANSGIAQQFQNPKYIYTSTLFSKSFLKDKSPDNKKRYIKERHQRIIMPFLPISMVSIALSLLLTSGFQRRGQTLSMTLSLLIGIAIFMIHIGLSNSKMGLSLSIPLMYANALLPIVFSFIWLWVYHLIFHPRKIG